MMERQPIVLQQNNEPVPIKYVPAQLELTDFLPRYRYQFESVVPEEADQMYNSFVGFLNENAEFLTDESVPDSYTQPYTAGFQRAVALFRLWIDSVYVSGEIVNGK